MGMPEEQKVYSIADLLRENQQLQDTVSALTGSLQEEVDRVRKLQEEAALAYMDSLTGAKNRRGADAALDMLKADFYVLLLDIDHFKQVNDRFGHEQGDVVLKALVGEIASCVRTDDVIARYGKGDEFMVILPESTLAAAMEKAEYVRAAIEAKEWKGIPSGIVTLSIGIAYGAPGVEKAQVIREADEKLYQAKREGRNRVVYFMIPRRM